MPVVLSVVNEKGGVGKTATSINLARALTDLDHRILVLDADSQGNATTNILSNASEILSRNKTLYEVVMKGIPPAEAIINTGEGFDLIPSTFSLAALAAELVSKTSREKVLAKVMKKSNIVSLYDFIIIDCPAAVNTWFFNLLAYSDYTITPITPEVNAIRGIHNLNESVKAVCEDINPNLQLGAVFINNLTDGQVVDKMVINSLENMRDQGLPLLDTRIHRAAVIRQSETLNQSIFTYAPKSRAAQEWLQLGQEIKQKFYKEVAA